MKKEKQISRKRLCILLLAAVLLAGAIFGVYRLATYRTANHADRISSRTLLSYNRTITGKAIATGNIRAREIVLLHTLTKAPGQDPVAVFYIYQLPEGANGEDYMNLQAQDVTDEMGLEYVGTLSCRFVEDAPNSAYDMRSTYIR